jgi:hypothetical protein
MDNKINDIHENLGEDLDLTDIYTKIEIDIDLHTDNSLNDLYSCFDDLNYRWNTSPKLKKLKTKNFDSVIKDKRLKDIDLSTKVSFFKTLFLWLKWKVSLSW